MSYPRKYPTGTGDGKLEEIDWDTMVDRINGYTPSGTFISPFDYVISKDATPDYYASNAFQTIFGGPGDAGGVDGADITAVIQAAHNNLPAEGGHIHLTNLNEEIEQVNITKSGVTISGNGRGNESTVGTLLYPKVGETCIFYVSGTEFTMYNMHLFGYNGGVIVADAHGVICTETADYPHIHDCVINRFSDSALELLAGCNVFNIHNNYFSCYGTDDANSSAVILGSVADGFLIGNSIGGGYYSLKISSATYLTIVANKIFGASQSHIYSQMGHSNFTGNIVGGGTPNPTFHNLYINNNAAGYGSYNTICGNRFYNAGQDGIRLQGTECGYNVITGNMIYSPDQHGWTVFSSTCDYNTFTSNNIYDAGSTWGIQNESPTTISDLQVQAPQSLDLSGANTNIEVYHAIRPTTLIGYRLLYTEASSADAGVAVRIGMYSDGVGITPGYFDEVTSEVSKNAGYTKYYVTGDLAHILIDPGETVTVGTVGGKVGTGEVLVLLNLAYV